MMLRRRLFRFSEGSPEYRSGASSRFATLNELLLIVVVELRKASFVKTLRNLLKRVKSYVWIQLSRATVSRAWHPNLAAQLLKHGLSFRNHADFFSEA